MLVQLVLNNLNFDHYANAEKMFLKEKKLLAQTNTANERMVSETLSAISKTTKST